MQTLDKPPSCLYQAMQTRETFSKAYYTMMWIICALWLVVAHDLSEDRYMADVTENLFWLFCSTLRVVLKMFVRLFWVKASESLKKISRSYLQRRKMEKQRQKEPFTTRECLNYKKSSQLLPSCVIGTRFAVVQMFLPLFCFGDEKTLKIFQRNCTHIKWRIKEEAETNISIWDITVRPGQAFPSLTN